MNPHITPTEEKVGLLLANGFTKKEIANKLGNSVKTICRHSDSLYKKTNSKNLADITRFMFSRYSGSPETILVNAMNNLLAAPPMAFRQWVANTQDTLTILKATLFHRYITLKQYQL